MSGTGLPMMLRLPREDEEEEFLRAHRATSPEVPYFLHYYTEGMAFGRYLQVSLQIARERLALGRILVTCDDDNLGSIRTIEKNGGVLDSIVSGPDLKKPKRRYWIEAA
jgi:hypothetical protein